MTAEHISRAHIARQTGSATLGLLAGEIAYTDRRVPFWSRFGAGFLTGAAVIVFVIGALLVRHG